MAEKSEGPVYSRQSLFPGLFSAQISTLQEFVPEAFFEPDTDPVSITLAHLPCGTNPVFLATIDARTAGELSALDLVSRTLNQNLLDNYQDVLTAMNMISSLDSELDHSSSTICQTRQILGAAHTEICCHPEVFFRQVQKRANLGKVLDLLQAVDRTDT
jgi:hypothetical protein